MAELSPMMKQYFEIKKDYAGKTSLIWPSTRLPPALITMKPCRKSQVKSPIFAPCVGRNSAR